MNARKWIAGQIDNPVKSAMPCLFYPAVTAAGGSVAAVLADARRQAAILAAIPEKYPVGAVVRMSELWCEAAAFGAECELTDDSFPRITGPIASEAEDLADLSVPNAVNAVTSPMIASVEITAQTVGKPVFAGITGPYTLGSVLGGNEDFMVGCLSEPETIQAFLGKITAFLVDYALEYKRAGAAGVILAEPSISMISPEMAEDFSHRHIRRILDAAQDESFSVIYHNCGNVSAHLPQLAALGAHAYHFGDAVRLDAALETFPKDALVMGNIHPGKFAQATDRDMERDTEALLKNFAQHKNFIPSSGCDIGPKAKASNLDAFFAVCGAFYTR